LTGEISVEHSDKNIRQVNLHELVFRGRNTEYGAFYLRKKYPRYLLISGIIAVVSFLLAALIPLTVFYFREMEIPIEQYSMEVVEVVPMPPPEKTELLSAPPSRMPPDEIPLPVPKDSVTEPPKETPEEVPPEDTEKADSTGKNIHGSNTGEDGTGDNTIYTLIDVFPRYPGGDQARLYYLRTHLHYPEIAVKMRIEGIVILVIVIEPDGRVTNVQVAKGIGGGCDEEAVRVVREMPGWEPGKRSGRAVRVMVRMPIMFKLPGK
jgi:periplasmic protein TonB